MTSAASRSTLWALAALIVAAGAWLRIAGTLGEPLWLDEGYSAYAASRGFDFLWHVVPAYETHPPFYYSLLRVWTLPFGDSLGALRALGIACGLATLPVMALAGRELGRLAGLRAPWLVALAALTLAAFANPLVEMAREVRPYPVLILVYASAIWALLRLGRIMATEARIARRPFAAYLLCLALILWLHNLGVFYAASLGLAFLLLVVRRGLSRSDWTLIVLGHALVALVWLPALLILLDQAPTWVSSTWLRFSTKDLAWRLGALYAAPGDVAAAAALLLALLGIYALRARWRVAAALLLLAVLPAALSLIVSMTIAPVFIPRTMTAIAVPSLLLFAAGAAGNRRPLGWLGGGALLVLLSQMAIVDWGARHAPPTQNWYGTADWLAARYRPGDEIWSYPNEGALPLDFALRDKRLTMTDRPIPTPVPSLGQGPGSWNPTGSRGVVSLSRERLRALARSPRTRAIPTIWLHRLGANAYDKGDVLLEELSVGRVRVGRWKSGPIEIIGLRRADLVEP